MSSPKLVHIIGSGHSGSTLLDMLLGGHSQISSLGESHFITFSARKELPPGQGNCTCGAPVDQCPFWTKIDQVLRQKFGKSLAEFEFADMRVGNLRDSEGYFPDDPKRGYPYKSLANYATLVLGLRAGRRLGSLVSGEIRLHTQIGKNLSVLYQAVREAHGTPIIVDSAKNPGTFKNVYLETPDEIRFILVLRDGRAVTASRMRRTGYDMSTAARIWRNEHIKRWVVSLSMPAVSPLVAHYENMARQPENELRRICSWLNIAFEPDMLIFRKDRHNLGGNPMRLHSNSVEIHVDERWRSQLTAGDLEIFERIAGPLNRRLGYVD